MDTKKLAEMKSVLEQINLMINSNSLIRITSEERKGLEGAAKKLQREFVDTVLKPDDSVTIGEVLTGFFKHGDAADNQPIVEVPVVEAPVEAPVKGKVKRVTKK